MYPCWMMPPPKVKQGITKLKGKIGYAMLVIVHVMQLKYYNTF